MRPVVATILATIFVFAADALAQSPTQHSGYITINETTNSNIFFWVIEAQNVSQAPVTLWLSGGPGCSGEFAMFYENGPFSVDSQLRLHANPYSWHAVSTMIYVDQPYGTGFSYSNMDSVHDEVAVADVMTLFLQKLFQQFPQYSTQPFFISGESYAGRYVPSIAQRIVAQRLPFNLKGITLGNALVDPAIQYELQPTYASWEGLINHTMYRTLKQAGLDCSALIEKQQWNDALVTCGSIVSQILEAAGDVDPSNILHNCSLADCFNYSNITRYMNLASTKKSIGAQQQIKWNACSYTVQFTAQDKLSAFSPVIAAILEAKLRVLIYYGDKDLVLPWNGGLQWLWNMKWSGQTSFQKAPPIFWRVPGIHHDAGVAKVYDNLWWTTVLNAGHMAPHDKPAETLDMFSNFLRNQPFKSSQ